MLVGYKVRFFLLQFFYLFFFIVIFFSLVDLQFIKSEALIQEARKQWFNQPLFLKGDVRDRNGVLLGLDVIVYDLYKGAKPTEIINEGKINELSDILNINKQKFKEHLYSRKINTAVISGINGEVARKIKNKNLGFVYLKPNIKRIYPHGGLAAHILGFVNKDRNGQQGIELFYEEILKKLNNEKQFHLYPKGTDLVLTIDSALQEFAEEELKKVMQTSKAERGTIIALSPRTGEIYAWAISPTFNPNFYFKEKNFENWALTDIYQPGSTFKAITVSCALENMTINKDSSFYDSGSIKIDKRIIRNHHKNKPQYINLLELFKQSSNVASAQVGLTMKPEMFYNSLKNFMIGAKTNIDLPGESDGLLLSYKKWKRLDSGTTSFGQGAVSLTPLQLASAVASIANHGVWVRPHVLKGVWNSRYKLVEENPSDISTYQVISTEVADFVSNLLKQSVKENLASMSYIGGDIPGYEVAGKTGTAQKVNPEGKGYKAGHTVASFIGYFPANDPKMLILVVVDDPKIGGGWGNTVCGPIFNNVAKVAVKRVIEG